MKSGSPLPENTFSSKRDKNFLSVSKSKPNIVQTILHRLKGGFLLFSLGAGDTRATMDSDYLMKNLANEKERVESVIQEIIAIDNEGNVTFELMDMEIITEQNDYHGFRIKLF